ncbi:Transcriptional regulator ATRX like protein [Argiope bruennichi]|uniref:Transcriptional regulator ATRX like protein n=1 Tax=Argiope bruennichi TaxID=94029 RepID=A0A8T0E8S5_ARGBR|nr:Transcriptional regulator ATRX like protein [Argiope bruennichi]
MHVSVIVFSQSLLTFDLIEDLLSYLDEHPVTEEEEARDIRFTWKKNVDYFRMDGSTSAEFRKQYIDHFNDPNNDRFDMFTLKLFIVVYLKIDRHFNASELAELYNFDPESLPNRPTPMVPKNKLFGAKKNEKEGRYAIEDLPLEETIKGFCREPDFNEAIYEGSVIPTAKSMIEAIIAAFRKQYPTSSAVELRKKLQMAIYTLRAMFQEKHVKILRMKQEYVAKGSVPVAVNKYLEEVNHIVSDLTMHHENVSQLVNRDIKAAYEQQMAQKINSQMQQNQQQQFGNRPFSMPVNANYPRMNAAAFGQRLPFIQVRMNAAAAAAANLRPGNPRWTFQSQNFSELYKRLAANQNAQQKNTTTTPEPVITEMETNDISNDTHPNVQQNNTTKNAHSTVEITEIE